MAHELTLRVSGTTSDTIVTEDGFVWKEIPYPEAIDMYAGVNIELYTVADDGTDSLIISNPALLFAIENNERICMAVGNVKVSFVQKG